MFRIIFFFTILFSSVLMFQTESFAADDCHTTADGKVIVENSTGSGTVPSDDKPLSIDGGTSFVADFCMESPLFYKMEGYKIFLCERDPYRSGASPILSVCPATIISRTDDNPKDIIIPLGEQVDLLDGEELILPVGSYSHAVLIGGNHLAVKHNVEFVRNDDNAEGFTMDGYKPGTGGPNTGVKCWTIKDKATTYNNISASNHTTAKGDTRAFTNPTPGGETTLTLTCGASIVTTEGDDQEYGFAYEIIDSISDTCDNDNSCDTTFGAHSDYFSDSNTNDGTERAFTLIQADETIATSRTNAVKIAYIAKLPTPIKITEGITGFQILISTNSTVSLDVHRSGADPQTLEAKKMGVDPFGVKFQTKTKRTRGAWR